jgi:hypothetical protein
LATRRLSVPEAIQGGWRRIVELESTELTGANVAQRQEMLSQLIDVYWTGSAEEEAIIRILDSAPLAQAVELMTAIDSPMLGGETYAAALDRVVDFGNNLELHSALSRLQLKAMGPQRGTAALEAAPILPWHDVMGFFEDDATFKVSSGPRGSIRVEYPSRVHHATDFGAEPTNLPFDIYVAGHDFLPEQVLVIHDYDTGKFVPVTARELIGYYESGIRGFLGHAATVGSFAIPVSAATTAVGKAAVITFERVLPALILLADENRLNIVRWWPRWGPRMLYFADLAKVAVGVYGVGRFVHSGWSFFKSWRDVRRARQLWEGVAVDAEAERVAQALESQADELFGEAEKFHAAEGAKEGALPPEAPTGQGAVEGKSARGEPVSPEHPLAVPEGTGEKVPAAAAPPPAAEQTPIDFGGTAEAPGPPLQLFGPKVGPAFATAAEAEAQGEHVVEVVLRRKTGEEIARWFEASETGQEFAGHTEQKALTRIRLSADVEVEFRSIKGYPPCPYGGGCMNTLRGMAELTGTDITYRTHKAVFFFPGGGE